MNVEQSTDGGLTAWFAPVEVELLRLATSQLVELLSEADDDGAMDSDPAIRRMLPDAYSDDPEAALEFRRFTASGLLDQKIENATLVRDTLANVQGVDDLLADHTESTRAEDIQSHELVVIEGPAVLGWLRTLTDLRLTLAERLQMSPDGEIHLDGEEAEFLNDLYDWLGMVQESFIYAIDA